MRPLTKISLFGIRLATCVLIAYWLLLFTGTHLPAIPKVSPLVTDKILHFTAFLGLTVLLCWVVQTRKHVWRKFAWIAATALTYAAFDELTQSFVRGRTTDVKDFAADALGIATAIVAYAAARRAFPQWTSATAEIRDLPAVRGGLQLEAIRHAGSHPRATSVDQDSINVA